MSKDTAFPETFVVLDRSETWTCGAMFSAWALAIFAFTGGSSSPFRWILSWMQWDALWYEKIWRVGYAADLRSLVFPPGFSYLIGSVADVLGAPFSLTAMLINLPALFLAGLLTADLIQRRFSVRAPWAFAFFLCSPAAYFAFAPYSDALFLLLFTCALRLALKDPRSLTVKERAASLLLLLALPWFRLTGYACASWLALRRGFSAAVFVSLAGWLLLNRHLTGSPFYFLKAQSDFVMTDGNFATGLIRTLRHLQFWTYTDLRWDLWAQLYALPFVFLAFLLALSVWFAARREWLLAVTIASVTLLSHNQALWRSGVRYDLVVETWLCVPLLIEPNPAKAARIRRVFTFAVFFALCAIGLAMQVHYAQKFRSGQWAF